MKKITFSSIIFLSFIVSSCNGFGSNNGFTTDTIALKNDRDMAIAERDSLISLFNEINSEVIQLREVESVISTPSNLNSESNSTKLSLRDDIASIRETLRQRREKLNEIESKLSKRSKENAQLLKMIENLKDQLNQSEQTIAELTQQLTEANVMIAGLNNKVDSLSESVSVVSAENESVRQQNDMLNDEINRCYYVIGSKKELEKQKIIESGFLRSTKVMQGNYNSDYFTVSDKRTLRTIPCYSKNAKVLTNQPKDSYTITTDAKGNKSIEITNPTRFWNAQNYLVIQTN